METTERIRILLVDDENAFRMVLAKVLRAGGPFEVAECDSGESAIEELKRASFDVVILDYKMPGLSGLNVMQWMHEQKMETPVIVLTAAGSETIAVEAMKLGAYDYFRKEMIDIDHVPLAVRSVYERYLFHKERQQREREKLLYGDILTSVALFHKTTHSLGELVGNSLDTISNVLEVFQKEIMTFASEDARIRLSEAISDLKQEFSIVAAGTRSIFNLSSSMASRVKIGRAQEASIEQSSESKVKPPTPDDQSEDPFV